MRKARATSVCSLSLTLGGTEAQFRYSNVVGILNPFVCKICGGDVILGRHQSRWRHVSAKHSDHRVQKVAREEYEAARCTAPAENASSSDGISLTDTEVDLIIRTLSLPAMLIERLKASSLRPASLSAVEAKLIGDAATLRLAEAGFDEAYEVTPEGRELERLIDRLMT
jgi:hypothetical protein